MRKDTAKKYAIHVIMKIKDMIEKEYAYSQGILNGAKVTELDDIRIKKYVYRSELCSYFIRQITNNILDEFENNERGEYNFYD